MTNRGSWRLWCLMWMAAAALACSSDDAAPKPAAAPGATAAEDQRARTLPIPGTGAAAGHPAVDSGAETAALRWKIPEHWVVEPPSNRMRVAQYRVPGKAGDGECVVFYFGPGQGGDAMANAQRWAGQFTKPDGTSAADTMQLTELASARLPLYLVEVTGTYSGGMSGMAAQDGYMLLGGIAQGPDAPWFFKFVGPEATVRAEREAFVQMMESVGTDG